MNFSDEQLQQALANAKANGDTEGIRLIQAELKARAPVSPKDIAMSAGSGFSKAIANYLAGGLAAKIGIKPQRAEALVEKLPWHKPSTTEGQYAERMGAGAAGPGPIAGAAGGALSQYFTDKGYDTPLEQFAAWMLPSILSGGSRALFNTSAPAKDAARVLAETSPMNVGEINANVADAAARGVRLPVWQAAGENTPVRRLGEGIAKNPNAAEIQKALMEQEEVARQGQGWVKGQTDARYQAITGQPVDPAVMQNIRDRMTAAASTRWLDPESRDAAVVASTIRKFRDPAQNLPPQSTSTALGPQTGGSAYIPTRKSVGNVLSLKQEIQNPPINSDFVGSTDATRLAMTDAVDKAMAQIPGYTEANRYYGRTKDIAEILSKDQRLRGANVNPLMALEAKTAPASIAMVGLGTNPWWSFIPYVREKLGAQAARKLDAALASSDMGALAQLALEHPQLEGLIKMITQAQRSEGITPPLNLEALLREYSPIPLPGGGK